VLPLRGNESFKLLIALPDLRRGYAEQSWREERLSPTTNAAQYRHGL